MSGREPLRRTAIVVLAALAATIPMLQDGSATHAAAPARMGKQTSVLYRWSIPKSGHVGAWQAKNGVLSYDGVAVGAALPRYTVPANTNFAVQAMLRTTGPGAVSASLNGFGLVTRTKRSSPHTSVQAGQFYNAEFQSNQEDNSPELYWNGQTIEQQAFQPGKAWHLYRLTVQDDQYSLSIDGKPMVSSAIPDYPNPTSVGVFSWYYQVQVKQFEVDAIGPASNSIPFDPVPRDANVTVSDLPTSGFYLPYLQHWYTNEETAREGNESLSSVQGTGRIASYGVEFFASSRDFTDVYSVITAFGTPAQAQASVQSRIDRIPQEAALIPGSHDLQMLTGLNLGDLSGGFRVDGSAGSVNVRAVAMFFARGRYTVFLRVVTDPDPGWAPDAAKSVQQVTDMARTIDGRLPHS